MKLLNIFTLSSVVFASFSAYADSAEYKECRGEPTKSCLTYKINFPSYPYPWLTEFVLQESFSKKDANIEDLDDLVKQYVAENISPEPSNDSESNDWSGAEEGAGFVQIAKTSDLNSDGAAHGLESIDYYVFDQKNHNTPIPIEEIIEEGAIDKLSQVLEEIYIQWQIDHNLVDKESSTEARDVIQGFVEDGKMPLGDSWYFAKDMIVFSYAPYEIGPYAYGTVELPLPVNGLKGLIKMPYLQAASKWKTPFQP